MKKGLVILGIVAVLLAGVGLYAQSTSYSIGDKIADTVLGAPQAHSDTGLLPGYFSDTESFVQISDVKADADNGIWVVDFGDSKVVYFKDLADTAPDYVFGRNGTSGAGKLGFGLNQVAREVHSKSGSLLVGPQCAAIWDDGVSANGSPDMLIIGDAGLPGVTGDSGSRILLVDLTNNTDTGDITAWPTAADTWLGGVGLVECMGPAAAWDTQWTPTNIEVRNNKCFISVQGGLVKATSRIVYFPLSKGMGNQVVVTTATVTGWPSDSIAGMGFWSGEDTLAVAIPQIKASSSDSHVLLCDVDFNAAPAITITVGDTLLIGRRLSAPGGSYDSSVIQIDDIYFDGSNLLISDGYNSVSGRVVGYEGKISEAKTKPATAFNVLFGDSDYITDPTNYTRGTDTAALTSFVGLGGVTMTSDKYVVVADNTGGGNASRVLIFHPATVVGAGSSSSGICILSDLGLESSFLRSLRDMVLPESIGKFFVGLYYDISSLL